MRAQWQILGIVAIVLVSASYPGSVVAEIHTGNFSIGLEPFGGPPFETGLNDGWTSPDFGGPWFEYGPGEDPFGLGTWQNQWWYDDPFDADRRKEIDLSFSVAPLLPIIPDGEVIGSPAELGSFLEITVNWSNGAWSEQGLDRPPLPGEDEFIERGESNALTLLYSYEVDDGISWELSSGFPYDGLDRRIVTSFDPGDGLFAIGLTDVFYGLDDFNPEWVSVDVRGYNVLVEGTITHECLPKPEIPEPATISLMGLSLLGLAIRKVRKS